VKNNSVINHFLLNSFFRKFGNRISFLGNEISNFLKNEIFLEKGIEVTLFLVMAATQRKGAITITFGDQVENGIGMEQIGEMIKEGFTPVEIEIIAEKARKKNLEVIHYDVRKLLPKNIRDKADPASILVVRQGVEMFACPDKLYEEQIKLKWDEKKLSRGRIVNSLARKNLCYADFSQSPEYEKGKGRVYDFGELPELSKVRNGLGNLTGKKGKDLLAEGNYYYDLEDGKEGKCGIGWHGDAERRIVIGLRLGCGFPIEWNWYKQSEPVGKRLHIDLHHGDFYIMSDKTTGYDWKRGRVYTLRHAAGNKKKYLDANGEANEYVLF
jgi:alkylated DNA repair dioxygenase AlkB